MRAWNCHGRTQHDLVDRMIQARIVTTPIVKRVLEKVDRKFYIPNSPYTDAPQSIGLGQTISAPHMHAHVLEEIVPVLQRQKQKQQQQSLRILDVGCGSGYLTACFGRLMHDNMIPSTTPDGTDASTSPGQVYGIDIHQYLVDLSEKNILSGTDRDLLTPGKKEGSSPTVKLFLANGWMGLPQYAPFDAIHVGAAANDFPKTLAMQLKVGGVLIVPVGPVGGVQNLYRVDRVADHHRAEQQQHAAVEEKKKESGGNDGTASATTTTGKFVESDFRITELLSVRYVPLVHGPREK